LLNNPCSITQIALDCGFADGAHFSRDFRAHFGLSPRQYQQARSAQATGQEGGVSVFPA